MRREFSAGRGRLLVWIGLVGLTWEGLNGEAGIWSGSATGGWAIGRLTGLDTNLEGGGDV